jgi:hypothetical protein
VLEVRRLDRWGMQSCFLTPRDINRVATLIADSDHLEVSATYITLNPVAPSLLSHSHARFRRVGTGQATQDAHIVCRRLLLIDFDPERVPHQQNSTDAEKAGALQRALDCRSWLVDHCGWSPPVLADSGNGYHLLFQLAALPVSEASDRNIAAILKLLHRKFSDAAVKLDTSVANPSRMTKLYGTWTRKGQPTFERPWHRSRLLEIPEGMWL